MSGADAPRVDAGDILFLIVRHLRACGLSASAMALLHESGVDTAWLCGPAPELRLLRDWVFAGDFKRVRSLLEPLAFGLSPPEHRAMLAIVDRQQLLETILMNSHDSRSQSQRALLDELHARRNELQLSELEFAWCLHALDDRSIRISSSQRHTRVTAQRWDVDEARMQCFERLVPFFRGEISSEEYEHKYLAMPSTQLVSLLQDAVTSHRERATDEGTARLDCVSIRYCHSTQNELRLQSGHADALKDHLLFLGEAHRAPKGGRDPQINREKLQVSQSVDWSKTARGSWTGSSADVRSKQAKQHVDVSTLHVRSRRTDPVAMSLDFDRMRSLKQPEPVLEEEVESEDVAVNADPATSEPSHEDGHVLVANVVVFDAATQTDDCSVGDTSCYIAVAPTSDSPPLEVEPPTPAAPRMAAWQSPTPEPPPPFYDPRRSEPSVRSSAIARSFASDSSHSVCIDDDLAEGHAVSFLSAIRSPISRYLEELNENSDDEDEEEGGPPDLDNGSTDDDGEDEHDLDRDLTAEVHDDSALDLAAESDVVGDNEEPEQHCRPERYDQLAVDHVVQASVVAEVKEAHAVRAIDTNADGSHLAIGTNARALRVFDLTASLASTASGSCTSTSSQHGFLPLLPVVVERHKHHQTSIYCVAFNNTFGDSKAGGSSGAGVIASGDADSCIKVLSLVTNKEQVIRSHPGKSRALHFAAANLLWSSSTGDRRIRCWDLEHSLSKSCLDLDGHVGEIQTLAFSSARSGTASSLLSAALDKTIRLWDARSGKCEQIVARTSHPVFAVQFDPSDSRYFASGHQDGGVSVWDLRVKSRALETLAHHQDECRAISWSPDGSWLLSSSFDGTICVMQVEQRAKLLTPLASYHQHQDKVLQAQWHPTRPAIMTTSADKLVKLWAFS